MGKWKRGGMLAKHRNSEEFFVGNYHFSALHYLQTYLLSMNFPLDIIPFVFIAVIGFQVGWPEISNEKKTKRYENGYACTSFLHRMMFFVTFVMDFATYVIINAFSTGSKWRYT
jgi:hypothetical protein